MTKMANSSVGYIALLPQLASFCKGWVGDHCRDRSISIMGWAHPTYIYICKFLCIYIYFTRCSIWPPPNKISGYANGVHGKQFSTPNFLYKMFWKYKIKTYFEFLQVNYSFPRSVPLYGARWYFRFEKNHFEVTIPACKKNAMPKIDI